MFLQSECPHAPPPTTHTNFDTNLVSPVGLDEVFSPKMPVEFVSTSGAGNSGRNRSTMHLAQTWGEAPSFELCAQICPSDGCGANWPYAAVREVATLEPQQVRWFVVEGATSCRA